MRQLDLFGSFTEVPSGEGPEEKPVVSQKEQQPVAADRKPSYSKNLLRSEQPEQDTLPINDKEPGVDLIDIVEMDATVPSVHPNTLLTLFDVPVARQQETHFSNVESNDESKEIKKVSHRIDSDFVNETDFALQEPESRGIEETVEPNIALVVNGVTPSVNKLQEVNMKRKVDLQKPSAEWNREISGPLIDTNTTQVEVDILEPANDLAPLSVIHDKGKAALTKPTAYSLPELQRNGEVVFDDGKITVKIKNKSPFPAPLVKVKKEKVKKIPQKRGRKSFKEIDAEVDLIEIPEDEVLFLKQYYAISEVAKWFRVNTSLLRYWENEFDVLKPRKNRKGDRLFRPEDVKNLQLIYQLLRQKKYTIEGAKEYIKTNKRKADIQLQLTNTLQKFRSFLLDMKANLQS